MHGQANSTFGALSIVPGSQPQRHNASGYLLLVLFAVVALASFKGGAHVGAALCAFGALLSAPAVRQRLCGSSEQAALGYNVMTVGLVGLLLVGLDVLAAHGQGGAPVASMPIAAAQAESLGQVAVPAAGAESDFLEVQKHKYGTLAGLPVQILANTGGLTRDVLWSQRSSECIVGLSTALIEHNEQDFRATLGSCVQQARQACAVVPAAAKAAAARSGSAIQAIGAQCEAMRSQAARVGI